MPELSDQQLKDRVQKLENLLRAREERIVALETENAMLYLKLAQCQGSVRSCRHEATHFRRLFDEEQGFRKTSLQTLRNSSDKVQELKLELHDLKKKVKVLPELLAQEMEKTTKLTNQFGSMKMSNMEGLQSKLLKTEMEMVDFRQRYIKEKSRRMTLHNTLVEIRGNIRVHCRLRPCIGRLDSPGDEESLGMTGTPSEKVVELLDEEKILVKPSKPIGGQLQKKEFEFERVYGPETDQESLFDDVAPLLTSLLDGYNVCIMAYGQTGSGKTHTMLGSHDLDMEIDSESLNKDEGIIPRSAKEMFRLINERENPDESYSLEMSVCEIYNNEVRDLLAGKNASRLDIVTSSEGATEIPSLVTRYLSLPLVVAIMEFYPFQRHFIRTKFLEEVDGLILAETSLLIMLSRNADLNLIPSSSSKPTGLSFEIVNSFIESMRKIERLSAEANFRTTCSSHSQNVVSVRRVISPAPGTAAARSRSPSPTRTNGSATNGKQSVKTKLQLVDLAGSECVGMSGVTGAALRETSHINKSLSALADVLGALSEQRSHIPYRNTRLTHMLQDTIGGDAKLLVMLCVSPAQRFITETLQCLGFGSRARQVARGQTKKRRPTSFVPNSISLDLSQVGQSLRNNGNNLSPRILDLRGGGRRKSNFNFD
ncbi:unnamed protein product [Porites evermanni]|uniref:Kinesin motor domain-containing protein n=1 Tax=Porites evermanni TaxID=104178 RepID=A0ABN8MVI6_9CNID|nr:unnamed protein product [Porites evermanni]